MASHGRVAAPCCRDPPGWLTGDGARSGPQDHKGRETVPTTAFDQSNIRWYVLEGIDNAYYHVCSVDEENKIVDVLFKFDANKQVILHRHHAAYRTLVLQGELRIYKADGALKEIRPVGSYVERPAAASRIRKAAATRTPSYSSPTAARTA